MTNKERAAWNTVATAFAWLRPDAVVSEQKASKVVQDAVEAIDELLADGPDETPRFDPSLRGWVLVNDDSVWWANECGISEEMVFSYADHGWDSLPDNWYIRPLTPADVDGWSGDEIMNAVTYAWENTPYDAEAAAFRDTARAALQDMRREA